MWSLKSPQAFRSIPSHLPFYDNCVNRISLYEFILNAFSRLINVLFSFLQSEKQITQEMALSAIAATAIAADKDFLPFAEVTGCE